LFRLGVDKNPKVVLSDISDDDLVAQISQVMWRSSRSRDKSVLLPELEQCYAETRSRGKPHLWQRAKDCFWANQRQRKPEL